VYRDERTDAVENSSYRWAYHVLSYGLLASVGYRSFVMKESSWDLLALLIAGGATATLYQGTHRVLSRRWLLATVVAVVIAIALAAFALVRLR
jgi:hypothetical protein